MKRLLLLVLAMMLCAAAACAEQGAADISFDGEDYSVVFLEKELIDEKAAVTVGGLGNAFYMKDGQLACVAWLSADFDGETIEAESVYVNADASHTFCFDRDELPQAVWLIPWEDPSAEVLLWRMEEELPAEAPEEAAPEADEEDDTLEQVFDALGNGVYRFTYTALQNTPPVALNSKGEIVRSVQQTLIDFGQDIQATGTADAATMNALNAVQSGFGLKVTPQLDAKGYAELMPMLLMLKDEQAADALFEDELGDEYLYRKACVFYMKGYYGRAKEAFRYSGYGDWEARVALCAQSWPKTGELYRNDAVSGSATELHVKFNSYDNKAIFIKIYTTDGTLARTMFIGGTGEAVTRLPAGTYVIKDGTGEHWYGEEDSFGEDGYYEIMTFSGGAQSVQLKSGYVSTITVNVQEHDPNTDSVGSAWESWAGF